MTARVPVLVLAAGLGTRLRPLTAGVPKPLLPLGDRPALAHVLDRVRGVARPGSLVANAHHRAADLRAFAALSAPDLQLSEEARILGTAGGLAAAASLLGDGPALVWNGDIVSSLDPGALVAAHGAHAPLATLAVRPLPRGGGNVGLDREGRIVRLRRETPPANEGREVTGGAFLGVHVVGEDLRATLPDEGCLVGDVYLPALREAGTLRAFDPGEVSWHDIGTLQDYQAACFAWLDARGGGAFVDPSARVAQGLHVERSIVGRGASLTGEGRVARCVVWPDAEVVAPLADAVVTPWGALPFSVQD